MMFFRIAKTGVIFYVATASVFLELCWHAMCKVSAPNLIFYFFPDIMDLSRDLPENMFRLLLVLTKI